MNPRGQARWILPINSPSGRASSILTNPSGVPDFGNKMVIVGNGARADSVPVTTAVGANVRSGGRGVPSTAGVSKEPAGGVTLPELVGIITVGWVGAGVSVWRGLR